MAWISRELEQDIAEQFALPAQVPVRDDREPLIFRPDGLDVGVLADELDLACTATPEYVPLLAAGVARLSRRAAEAASSADPTISEHYARLGLCHEPYDVPLRVHLADSLRAQDRAEEAVVHGEAVVSIGRRDRRYLPDFWVAHAATLLRLGRHDEALAVLEDGGPNWATAAGHAELLAQTRAAAGRDEIAADADHTVVRSTPAEMEVPPPPPPVQAGPAPRPVQAAAPAPAAGTMSDDHTVRLGLDEVADIDFGDDEDEDEDADADADADARRRGWLFGALLAIIVLLAGLIAAITTGALDLSGSDGTEQTAGITDPADGGATEPETDPPDDGTGGDGGDDDPGAAGDELTEVPNVIGLNAASAGLALRGADLEMIEVTAESYAAAPGEVVSAEPGLGTQVETGSTVTVVIAERPEECNDVAPIVRPSSFTDIGGLDAEVRAAVDWAVDTGLVSDGTEYNPRAATTRAAAVTVLWRYMCEPSGTDPGFDDVPASAFFADAVGWAASAGVVGGKSPTEFVPDDPITRAEFITVVWRALDEPAGDGTLPFEDVPATAFYRDALDWAFASNLVNGTSPTTFDPEGDLDRITTVVLFERLERRINPLVGPVE